jgi:Na+-driven multidrug efflux pump
MNSIVFWIIQLPLAWWLARLLAFGPPGVFIAIVACESLLALAGIILVRQGHWRHRVA